MLIQENSLYYFFSTVAQVLAATSALLAIFSQFKISELNNFLIGDGKATFERMNKKETGYTFIDEAIHNINLNILRDAIGRRSIFGIFEIINLLSIQEFNEKITIADRPRGLQYLEKRFIERKSLVREIKSLTKKSIITAFITIFISIISLIFVEKIVLTFISIVLITIVVISSAYCFYLAINGMIKGLNDLNEV